MSECSHDCSSCSANCGSRTQEKTDFLEPLYRESKVKKVIGIVSGKGGVGKSMTTWLAMKCKWYCCNIIDITVGFIFRVLLPFLWKLCCVIW